MGSLAVNDQRQDAGKSPASKKLKPGLAPRLVATTLLTRVVDDGRNLDALTDRQHGLGAFLALEPNDRGLARAIAITALRNRNAIDLCLSRMWSRPPPRKARFLWHMLHVAAAQILFLEIPDRAAVDLAVSAIGDDERTTRFRALANAVLRRMVREKDKLTTRIAKGVDPFPKWFEQQLRKDYGREKTSQIAAVISREPFVDITVKSDPESWADKLGGFVLPTGSIRLTTSSAIETLEGYKDGEWWVQDAAAALPARVIGLDAPSRVLELCAAPGGKTAQLCHQGHDLTALDISKPRLARLEENLKRLKFDAKLVEADILDWTPETLFDAVLLDTPCSSTGTIRRHPDVLWTRSKEEIAELAELQYRLLEKAATFVKPGGTLVFSNCSLFKQEGEDLLPRFLKAHDDFTLSAIKADEMPELERCINGQGALRTLPFQLEVDQQDSAKNGIDGFFVARFVRKPVQTD